MNIDERLEKAKQFAVVLKDFSSEAVQLRVLEYLLTGDHTSGDNLSEAPKSPLPKRKRNKTSVKVSNPKAEKKGEGMTGDSKKKVGRPGPGEMVNRLIDEGFFSQKRGINDIVVYCQKKLAYSYKTSDFGSTLARALRNDKLSREENTDGQYEYIKK
jgi:hypothetical protein